MRALRFASLALALSSAGLAQQPPPGDPRPPHERRRAMADPEQRQAFLLDILTSRLNLDVGQAAQLNVIFAQARTAAAPLQEDLQNAQRGIIEAVREGKPKAELDRLHKQIGATHASLAAVQTKAFADAYAILKPEQRQEAEMLYGMLHMLAAPRPAFGGPFGPPGPPPRRPDLPR